MRNLKDVIFIALLAIISIVDAWAGCRSSSWSNGVPAPSMTITGCSVNYSSFCSYDIPSTIYWRSGGGYFTDCRYNIVQYCNNTSTQWNCGTNSGYNGQVSQNSGCGGNKCTNDLMPRRVFCATVCDTQNEADSVVCVKDGYSWEFDDVNGMYYCNTHQCDTTMHCNSYVHNRCIDVGTASQITCVNGQCSGLPGALFYSQVVNECSNECGTILSSVISSDTVFAVGKSCYDDIVCGAELLCGEFGNGTYFLFRKCLVGRQTVGNVNEREQIPQIEYSGHGTCAENGYQSTSFNNSGNYGTGGTQFSNNQQQDVGDNCLIYGIGCVDYHDTTDYSSPPNQNPDKCWCDPFDGNGNMSRIVCPDGTSRVVFFSCRDWENMFASSSSAPPSGGSSASGAGSSASISSSTDVLDSFGLYPQYPTDQPTTNKNVQSALSGIGDFIVSIRDKLVEIKNYLVTDESETSKFDSISLSHGDYSQLDSVDIPKLSFDSLWSIIDTSAKILDTSSYVGVGTCPIINGRFSACQKIPFFRNNQDIDMKFDFSNFWGINLCTLIKSVVLAFASVVSTLISLKVFLKGGF